MPPVWLHTAVAWPGPSWWQQHVTALDRFLLMCCAWGVALVWVLRVSDVIRFIPRIARIDLPEWDVWPPKTPALTVVVPARDEADHIAATLDALLAADYPGLHVIAVDDRSTDATGAIMDRYAASTAGRPGFLEVIHITDLPDGWLGKVFALDAATSRTRSEYVLYTDADVLFSPSILRRAVAYAESTRADHLVVMPTLDVRHWSEGMVLGFCQIFGIWASRVWRIEDPDAKRDLVGVGAFNLVRRSALEELGGWTPQRMTVLEDVTLGRRMKASRMRQRIAFAPGFVLVHWAQGASGLMRGMTKNLFSAFNFRPLLLLGAGLWVAAFFLVPIAGLLWWSTMAAAAIILCCVGAAYRTMAEVSRIEARYGWLYPLGALVFVGAMLRSMAVVMWQRGVVWRGTFYSLQELRRHNSPFYWSRQAARIREDQVQARKLVRRAKRKAGR
jgi:cellulose synthase/poly-beta-1,6-N-acetylglucosamine synthase-like glycosyltransferase